MESPTLPGSLAIQFWCTECVGPPLSGLALARCRPRRRGQARPGRSRPIRQLEARCRDDSLTTTRRRGATRRRGPRFTPGRTPIGTTAIGPANHRRDRTALAAQIRRLRGKVDQPGGSCRGDRDLSYPRCAPQLCACLSEPTRHPPGTPVASVPGEPQPSCAVSSSTPAYLFDGIGLQPKTRPDRDRSKPPGAIRLARSW